MFTSHLALRADLGGALRPRHSVHRNSARTSSWHRFDFLKIGLRRLLLVGCSLIWVSHALATPALTLAWDANPETDIANYKLSYGTSSGAYSKSINAGPNTEVVVPDLIEGTTYFFAVAAVNTAGLQGPYSDEISHVIEPEPPPVNYVPVAISGPVSTREDTAVGITLQASDGNSDPLTFVVVDLPTKGNLSGTPPNLTYTPQVNYHGNDTFTFLANDGTVNSALATISITVSPFFDAPVVANKSVATSENQSLPVNLTGVDVDGDALTFTVVVNPSKGSLSGTPPNLTYTPNPGYNGSDLFTYRAFDGEAYSPSATVSISVSSINHAPVAANKVVTTAKDTSLPITLGAADSDGNTLTFVLDSYPAHGSLSGTPPNLTYVPTANYNGADSFKFHAFDGVLASNSATVSITVSAVNDAPVAANKNLVTNEDQSVAITLTGSDADGDDLTFSVISNPTKGSLSGSLPNLTYTPSANFNGSDQFTYRANDGKVNSATATVSITVSPVNDVPVVANKNVATSENQSLPITLTGGDVDGDALTFSVAVNPSKGSLSGTPPNLTYTPNPGFSGIDQFTFKAFDGKLYSTLAMVSISVSSINHAPLAANKVVTTSEDTSTAIYLGATDIDGNTLTYVLDSAPAHGSLSGTPPNLTYVPAANYNGADSFKFHAFDGVLASSSATVSITVSAVNDAPVVANTSIAAEQEKSIAITLTAADIEGSALTFFVASNPSKGTLSGIPPDLTYLPNPGFSGSDQFTFKAFDGSVYSSLATVSITVTSKNIPENMAPVFATALSGPTAAEGSSFSGQLRASDVNGDFLTFGKVSGPAWLTVSPTGALGGTPLNADVGSNTFWVKAEDPSKALATAALVITVTNTNDAPVFKLASFTYPEGSERSVYRGETLASMASDPDVGDTLTYSVISGPKWLSVSSDGKLRGSPGSGDLGANNFNIRATDADGAFANAVMMITINRNNLPSPWKLEKVGKGTSSDPAVYSAGVFTLAGTGSFSSGSDSANFGYQKLGGDGTIIARIKRIDNTGKATRIGLMIRQSLAPDSRQAFVGVDGDGKLHWINRTRNGGKSADRSRKGKESDNSWLKLTRKGNEIIAYRSSNGTIWRMIGSTHLELPKNCYVGLSVSSGQDGVRNISKFANVRVNH